MKQYLEESLQISAEDAKFMEMAIRLSEENIDTGGGPFGAVIVRDGEVIADVIVYVTDGDEVALIMISGTLDESILGDMQSGIGGISIG